MEECPCGSGRLFMECCQPYLQRTSYPLTAEALMRSRYSAYVTGYIDYIRDTYHPSKQAGFDVDAAKEWSRHSDWLGLEIIGTSKGQKEDATGVVQFRATYVEAGSVRHLCEKSRFERVDGKWVYVDGTFTDPMKMKEGK